MPFKRTSPVLAIFAVLGPLFTLSSSASEVSMNAGLLHLPSSSYHYLGYGAHVGLGDQKSLFALDFGMSQPFSTVGFKQNIYFGSAGWQWGAGTGLLQPYFGLGLGVFVDKIKSPASGGTGIVPSLTTQGGVKIGGSHLGLNVGLSSYLGIYKPSHLTEWTMWPLINVMAGLYVAI